MLIKKKLSELACARATVVNEREMRENLTGLRPDQHRSSSSESCATVTSTDDQHSTAASECLPASTNELVWYE